MRTQWMICHSLNGASSKYATAVQQGPTIDTVCRATLIGDVSATRTTVHPVQSTTSPFHFQACLTVTNGSGGSLTTTTDLMCSDGTGVGVVVGRGVCSIPTLCPYCRCMPPFTALVLLRSLWTCCVPMQHMPSLSSAEQGAFAQSRCAHQG